MDADGRAVAENGGEVLGRRRGLVAAAEAVIVVRLPQVAVALDALDDQVAGRAIGRGTGVALGDQVGQFGQRRGDAPRVGGLHRVRQAVGQLGQVVGVNIVGGSAVQDVEAGRQRRIAVGPVVRRQTQNR